MAEDQEESILLRFYLWLFWKLRHTPLFCLSEYYYKPKGKSDKIIVERYTLSFTILSFCLILITSFIKQAISDWVLIFVLLGVFRIFEMLVIQINAMFYDFYRNARERLRLHRDLKPYEVRGYVRITVMLLHNLAEITFWFAIFYLSFPSFFGFKQLNPITALTFSFFTMTTFGHPQAAAIQLENLWGTSVILIQAIIGFFITLLIISRFISLLRVAPSSDPVEKQMKKEEKAS